MAVAGRNGWHMQIMSTLLLTLSLIFRRSVTKFDVGCAE